jgi:hypothetical protein
MTDREPRIRNRVNSREATVEERIADKLQNQRKTSAFRMKVRRVLSKINIS